MNDHDPSLLLSPGYQQELQGATETNNITIIRCNYLKNIRDELLEENDTSLDSPNNEIIYINAEIEGIFAQLMIDTGANVSIINTIELERIQQECGRALPILPVNNIVLIGATGRQNKTIRKQVSVNVISKGIAINMVFLIATGLPFNILVGCDVLRRNSAIIDLRTERVSLFTEGITWTADLVGSETILPSSIHQQLRNINYIENHSIINPIIYNNTDEDLWSQKIQEIKDFRCGITREKLPIHQANKLISIYEKYRSVFSDEPGKVKNYQCKLKFRETVEFNRKSYPIAHSRKEAVRAEINKIFYFVWDIK